MRARSIRSGNGKARFQFVDRGFLLGYRRSRQILAEARQYLPLRNEVAFVHGDLDHRQPTRFRADRDFTPRDDVACRRDRSGDLRSLDRCGHDGHRE
ncbi:hypothetical protein [Bradyrhizobium sp. DASA03068]|uniref:hypothetical protein n=1 Tax=Bradyrhizobium sp. BLXBL-01 TaxID=3395915 RepID=UPI003F6F679C